MRRLPNISFFLGLMLMWSRVEAVSIACNIHQMPLQLEVLAAGMDPVSNCGLITCLERAKITCRAAKKCDEKREWVRSFKSGLQKPLECCSSDSVQLSPIIRSDILHSGEIARFRGIQDGTYTFGEAIVRLHALNNGASISVGIARYQCVDESDDASEKVSNMKIKRDVKGIRDPCNQQWGIDVGSVPGQRRHQRRSYRVSKRIVGNGENGMFPEDSPYCGVVINSVPKNRIM